MIADVLDNRLLYGKISERIKTALEYLAETDFSVMEPGRIDLDGSNLFVLIQKYETLPKDDMKWECHRSYIDVQFIAEGTEVIGFANVDKMKVSVPYNAEKDVEFLSGEGDYVTLSKGSYGIFFPQDAHKPKVAPNDIPGKVIKVVIKIKVS